MAKQIKTIQQVINEYGELGEDIIVGANADIYQNDRLQMPGCTVTRTISHAEGKQTTAAGTCSHAEGQQTYTFGSYSHTEGHQTTANGSYSHAEGYRTIVETGAHSEGADTTANGEYSHAEGLYTYTRGSHSHAEGRQTTADGEYSHAEGYNTYTYDKYSHAEGISTTASGEGSHAEGNSTTASGKCSHAEGLSTCAIGEYQTVIGKYNTPNGDHLFQVGCGSDDNHRKNAFAINKNENAHFSGNISTEKAIIGTQFGTAMNSPFILQYEMSQEVQVGGYNRLDLTSLFGNQIDYSHLRTAIITTREYNRIYPSPVIANLAGVIKDEDQHWYIWYYCRNLESGTQNVTFHFNFLFF